MQNNVFKKLIVFSLIISIIFVIIYCKSSDENPVASNTYNPPSDHTVSENGYMHKSGASNATTNCISCHGADLKGGTGPSCYTCHGKKWN